jgi:septum formation inhibitor-activating ATPase MinD
MPVIGVIPMTSAMATASENQLPVVTKNLAVSKAYEKLADYLVEKLKPRGKGRVPETPSVTKHNVDLLVGLVEEEGISLGTLEEEMKFEDF